MAMLRSSGIEIWAKIWHFLLPVKIGEGGEEFYPLFDVFSQGPHQWQKNDRRPSGRSLTLSAGVKKASPKVKFKTLLRTA